MRPAKGFTLIELMIVIAIIAIIAAIAIPGLLQAQRASNERNASASLKTIATAQADFRANDRDSNRVQDFWTYDVAGLYMLAPGMIPAASTIASRIKLIDISIASADTEVEAGIDITTVGSLSSYSATSATTVQPASAKSGYWYFAMDSDNQTGTVVAYKLSDGIFTALTTKNTGAFGFGAWPESMGVGRNMFVINENNTVFRRPVTSNAIRSGSAIPPGPTCPAAAGFSASAVLPRHWPSDAEFSTGGYAKLD
jgi:prepilin-type N-terminal cleavage/methylation domain-containing protein